MNRIDWRALACGRSLFHQSLRLMLARRLQRVDRRRMTAWRLLSPIMKSSPRAWPGVVGVDRPLANTTTVNMSPRTRRPPMAIAVH